MSQPSASRDDAVEADQTRGVAGPPPGDRLRDAREASGQQVEEVAAALHLTPAQIEALEAGDYAKFAAPIFVSGYLRKYALHLGLDPAPLLASLEQAGLKTPPIRSERPTTFPPPRRDLPTEARIGIAVFAGIVVLALAWYLMRPPAGIETPAPAVPAPASVAPDAVTEAPDTIPELAPAPPPEAAPPPDAALSPAAAPHAAEGPLDELVLSFHGTSWVEVVDVTGRRLAFRTGEDGDVMRLRGLAPFDILLGNAPNVSIVYNGAPYRDFPVNRQNVASFTLGRPGEVAGEEPADGQ
jgi:cytoskeleton protein RodZ